MRYSEVGETYIENAENIGSVLDDMDNIIAALKDILEFSPKNSELAQTIDRAGSNYKSS